MLGWLAGSALEEGENAELLAARDAALGPVKGDGERCCNAHAPFNPDFRRCGPLIGWPFRCGRPPRGPVSREEELGVGKKRSR